MRKKLFALIIWSTVARLANLIEFEYSAEAQLEWSEKWPACSGKMQSPIALKSTKIIPMRIPALETYGYHDFLPGKVHIKNNGHTVNIFIKKNGMNGYAIKRRTPYITGSVFKDNAQYEFEGFHFHWGSKNCKGAEHVLNGIRYPMELHIVHRNTKYADVEEAIMHPDGLSVLGILFHLQEENNDNLSPILAHFSEVKNPDKEAKLNYSITLASLLPPKVDTYYTYKGSLTTPPCSEAVTWIVFSSTVAISFNQMELFRMLRAHKGFISDNFRSLQMLFNRKVYVRKLYSDLHFMDPAYGQR